MYSIQHKRHKLNRKLKRNYDKFFLFQITKPSKNKNSTVISYILRIIQEYFEPEIGRKTRIIQPGPEKQHSYNRSAADHSQLFLAKIFGNYRRLDMTIKLFFFFSTIVNLFFSTYLIKYLLILFVSSLGVDFHWYRKDRDGRWSH